MKPETTDEARDEALRQEALEMGFPYTAWDYGFKCAYCAAIVYTKERAALVACGCPGTLCKECRPGWVVRQAQRTLAARYAQEAIDGPRECQECQGRYKYRPNTEGKKGDGSTMKHCRTCRPIVKARQDEEVRVRREAKARAKASERKARYAGPGRMGYVYRFLDADGALLYVGKTYNVQERLFGVQGHAVTKPWFRYVAVVTVAAFTAEDVALEAEAWAIHTEGPRYNVVRPRRLKARAPRALATYSGEL